MKKILVPIVGIATSLFSETITVEKGWNLFGSVVSIDLNKTFASYPQINLAWLYDNSSKNWLVYGNNQTYKDKISKTNYTQISKVERKSGFWILNDGEKIEVELKEANSSSTNSTSLGRKFLNVEANFSRTGNVVTDHVSGLKWEDQSTVFEGNFSQAEAYCSNLELDGISDWRVPTNKELWYLADRNRSNPAINPVFQNTQSSKYWSNQSVNYSDSESYGWTVNFAECCNSWHPKTINFYARCVAGDSSYEDINYSRDDSKNLVTDNSNGLMWQDQTSANSMTWSSAKTYCSDLSFGGNSDWRLPNIGELYSITDQRKTTYPSVNSSFNTIIDSWLWSSTISKAYSSLSWFVYFTDGRDFWASQTDVLFVVCVRDLK